MRRSMQLWDEQQLHDALCEAGFEPGDIQRFWQRYMFVGLMAVKRKASRQSADRWRYDLWATGSDEDRW